MAQWKQKIGGALRASARRLPFVPFGPRLFQLANEGGDRWRATAYDPYFVFPRPPRRAKFLTLHLDAEPAILRPRLFIDWGGGFAKNDGHDLGVGSRFVIRLKLGDTSGLKKIRLDPSDGPSRFRFRFALDEALTPPPANTRLVEIDLADFAAPAPGRRIGLMREPLNAQEHFLRCVELARRELAEEPAVPAGSPLISFVTPVYNTPPAYLDDLLASFREQTPGLCEWVLSDDGSTSVKTAAWLKAHEGERGVVIVRSAVNGGIAVASNAGIAASRGAWIGFVDHDDAIAPFAAALLARVIRDNPDVIFIYTDEAIADKKLTIQDFFFKPAYDDALLSGVNYINHLSLYRRDRLDEIGGFREGFDGSQDYDLLLRYLKGVGRDHIRHLPYPAYLWRRDGSSYSVKFIEKATINARRALREAYDNAKVEPALDPNLHRVRFPAMAKVSVVIPSKDSFALISRVIDGLIHGTDYPDLEIIVVDNGTTEPETLELYDKLQRENPAFKLDLSTAPFNFSRQINRGVARASGDLILLLNNDVEIVERGWLREMVECFGYPDTGIVGARLLYPDRTIQHAGVIVGLSDFAGHWFVGEAQDSPGPMSRLNVRSSLTAVTAACMMVSRACFNEVGGFDEETFGIAYNDVDFCLRAKANGYRAIYTPFATLIHHESSSRGRDDQGPNRPRFLRDQASLLERHVTDVYRDDAFSPWYDRRRSVPTRIALDHLPPAR